jgi:phosphatidylglycerophosphate synthase
VFTFSPNKVALSICSAVAVIIFLTDILDGYYARRASESGVDGRHWDSLGDKAFYIAMIVALISHGMLLAVVGWGLLFREVAMYIVRIWNFAYIQNILKHRIFTDLHGFFMYMTIIFGFYNMYNIAYRFEVPLVYLVNIFAIVSFGFGTLSIIKFLHQVSEE